MIFYYYYYNTLSYTFLYRDPRDLPSTNTY